MTQSKPITWGIGPNPKNNPKCYNCNDDIGLIFFLALVLLVGITIHFLLVKPLVKRENYIRNNNGKSKT